MMMMMAFIMTMMRMMMKGISSWLQGVLLMEKVLMGLGPHFLRHLFLFSGLRTATTVVWSEEHNCTQPLDSDRAAVFLTTTVASCKNEISDMTQQF